MFLVTMKSEKCLHVPCKKRKQIVQVVRVDCRKKKKRRKLCHMKSNMVIFGLEFKLILY